MLGPSGFFLPTEPGNTDNATNDIELIHISEDGFNELYRVCRKGRLFVYKALRKELRGNILYEELLDKDFNIGFSLNHTGICQYFGLIDFPSIGHCIVMEWIDGRSLESLISIVFAFTLGDKRAFVGFDKFYLAEYLTHLILVSRGKSNVLF